MSRALDVAVGAQHGDQQRGSRPLRRWWLPLLLLLLLSPLLAIHWKAQPMPLPALAQLQAAVEADVMAQVIAEHVPPTQRVDATPYLTSSRIRLVFPTQKEEAVLESISADVVVGEKGSGKQNDAAKFACNLARNVLGSLSPLFAKT